MDIIFKDYLKSQDLIKVMLDVMNVGEDICKNISIFTTVQNANMINAELVIFVLKSYKKRIYM